MTAPLNLQTLQQAVSGTAAAFRCVTEYQPAGGPGDKVFPPTYEGGKYAVERRRLPDRQEPVDCVLLDSVQSQANRMELALLDAHERDDIKLPLIVLHLKGEGFIKGLRITSLEAPHRIADALFRDALLNGRKFRESPQGQALDQADLRNATPLFGVCPTALVFGLWDSTGPRGGLGVKFQRTLVSEIVGIDCVFGVKTSSRIDPAGILKGAGPLYQARDNGWTLNADSAKKKNDQPLKLGKDGKPSEANHGNVTPTIAEGGATVAKVLQTTVLSLPALRRLQFPVQGKDRRQTDTAARTSLAALALCAATLAREQGCDLRSRCLLVPNAEPAWELLDRPTQPPVSFSLTGAQAVQLLKDAVAAAKSAGLPWMEEELELAPTPELVQLVKRSQELTSQQADAGEED